MIEKGLVYYFAIIIIAFGVTVEPVYYGHLGTNQKCPGYQGVLIFQLSLHNKVCGLCRCPYFQVS